MPWVWINEGVDTRLMNRYISGIVELLMRPDGPDELGVFQLVGEIENDPDMFGAVWAHLYSWQRAMIRDIRDKHDRRQETRESIALPRHDGRGMRGTKG